MNDVKKLYELWLEKTKGDEQTHAELLSIEGNDDEILDRFYKILNSAPRVSEACSARAPTA